MDRPDAVIVGASFAGLACARAAAARGVRTLVVERKWDPGAAPHTTGLLVQEAADALDVPQDLVRKIGRVRLYSPSLEHVDLVSPGYRFFATDTPALMRWLAGEASAAGAAIRCGEPWRGGARGRYLVGADGARSTVARTLGLGRNREFLLGAEAEVEGVGGVDPDCLHCFLDSELAPGYLGWVVPGVRGTQVGLATRMPRRPDLDAFVRKASRLFDFRRARVTGRRGGLIPVGGPVSPMRREGALLLGDAAGMVSPLTGGGIHMALRLGRLAGVALASHLLDGGTDPGAVVEAQIPRFRWKRLLRRAIDLRPPNALYDRLLGSRVARSLAAAVFFHHRGLFSKAAWRDLAAALSS